MKHLIFGTTMKAISIFNQTRVLILITTCAIALAGCGKLWNREIDCNIYAVSDETFWFPDPVGSQFMFKGSSGDSIVFLKLDNYIWHTTGYTTDTGCGCNDRSGQLLTAGNDSLWFNTEMSYIENNIPQRYETIGVVLNGHKSVFTTTELLSIDSIQIGGQVFSNIKKYELEATSDSLAPKMIILGQDKGILRIVLQNGMLLESNPINASSVRISDFNYSEGWCD
jgi:hypothetical protein